MYDLNEKIITFLPPDAIEPQAKEQLENISELPFVFHHVAVMPDCHLGKGATVGSVIATNGAIVPAAAAGVSPASFMFRAHCRRDACGPRKERA